MFRHKSNIFMALALVVALSGCDDTKAETAGAAAAPPPPEVGIVVLQPQTIGLTAELPGRVNAFKAAEIRPQVSGIILERNFEEGGLVQQGQQLYQIDPALYRAAFNTAQAQLQSAEASLRSANLLAQRYKGLISSRAVSQQEYDNAVAARDQAAAAVASAKAAVETAQINLNYTKVFSPITGRIGKSSVTPGALVTANQATPLALVQQLDPIYVDLTQSSTDLLRLRQRMAADKAAGGTGAAPSVELLVEALGQQPYPQKGELQFADVTVDPATGNVQIRAQFPNPDEQLLPGLFVRARLQQGSLENAFLVPQQAVVRNPDGSAMLWVVTPEGKAQTKPVTLAQALADKWVVTAGVAAGDRAIVEGVIKVQPGATVRTVDLAATPATTAPAAGAAPQTPSKDAN